MKKLKFILFIMYNFLYSFCMAGYISNYIYFGILFLFMFFCIIESIKNKKIVGKQKMDFFPEFSGMIIMYLILALISFGFQIYNNDYKLYVFSDLLYLITPLLISFFWINSIEENEIDKYFCVIIVRYIFQFILLNYHNFSIDSILAINWNDTKSSIFESSYAHDFLFLEIISLYRGKKKFALICMGLCAISFKRISFILSILIYVIFKFNIFHFREKKPVSKIFGVIMIGIFCIAPYIMKYVAIDGGAELIYNYTNFDIVKFSTGRIGLIRMVYNNISHFNGLGSTIDYMVSLGGAFKKLGSMHCDILRLYWEVTEVGVFLFAVFLEKMSRKNIMTFIMFIYLCILMITSHCLHALSTWLIFYMFVASCEKESKVELKEGKINEIEHCNSL